MKTYENDLDGKRFAHLEPGGALQIKEHCKRWSCHAVGRSSTIDSCYSYGTYAIYMTVWGLGEAARPLEQFKLVYESVWDCIMGDCIVNWPGYGHLITLWSVVIATGFDV